MIIGTGIDLVETARIRDIIEKWGNRFLNRIFTPAEIEYCLVKGPAKYQSFAARFAAKEAFFKALGTGMIKDLSWRQVSVSVNEMGKPGLEIKSGANRKMRELGADKAWLSISHIKNLAQAIVVLEK